MPSGQSTSTTTQIASSAPSNPDVNPTLSKLLKGVQSQYDANPNGINVDMNLYGGMGGTTNNALGSMLAGSQDPRYSQAFGATFDDMADTAAGGKMGMNDPGYAALRSNLINDVTTNDLSAFNNSGMFGSDSNRKSLSQGLGTALGGLDYANYQNDIAERERAQAGLAGAYGNTMLPGKTALGIGQMQDTDRQAALQAEYEQKTRAAQGPTDYLAKLSSLLAGNAAAGGMSSTSSSTVPVQQPNPLQLLLGGGLGLASLF
jgi:hypothetical protein